MEDKEKMRAVSTGTEQRKSLRETQWQGDWKQLVIEVGTSNFELFVVGHAR